MMNLNLACYQAHTLPPTCSVIENFFISLFLNQICCDVQVEAPGQMAACFSLLPSQDSKEGSDSF